MSDQFFEQPILNSPYDYPGKHWELDETRQPTGKIISTRRPTDFVTPIPKPRKRRQSQDAVQQTLDLSNIESIADDSQSYSRSLSFYINSIRDKVSAWRNLPDPASWKVTPTTEKLLQHWRNYPFEDIRPFFCQVEAVETAIWLAEVAPKGGKQEKAFLEHLQDVNVMAEKAKKDIDKDTQPNLRRVCMKLATGAGKTTVMAMLIAWQTLNAVRHPNSQRFTKDFLIVTPGITIRDRLQVLRPNDANSYYRTRDLVPSDMVLDLQKARIVITNYHAFKLRERVPMAAGTRKLLKGRGEEPQTLESEGQMIQRVMSGLGKNVLVINDEAHHCYREKPGEDEIADLKGDDKEEAKKNTEAARLWISGLEAVKRNLGVMRVYDLSATPFFLSGSGYDEGMLFPWTVSDFSLMDAIECGIVKLPRVPVADNVPEVDMPMFRNLWEHIGGIMPKKGRANYKSLDPLSLPKKLYAAIDALYGHYAKIFEEWQERQILVPPVFIVVCNNTATSKLLYDYISGFMREDEDGKAVYNAGRLALFRNYDDYGNRLSRPKTLLIDSEQLESGDALDKDFKTMAADEIERFRYEIGQRSGAAAAEKLTDQDLLREVMNTVGKEGKLGAEIRCVVSVSMLTEGWDCLDSETEILTPRGWVGRGGIEVGEEVYSLNRETGKLEVVPVLDYGERQVRPDECMVRIESPHLNIRVTEGHEFHLKYRNPRDGGKLSEGFITKTGYQLYERKSRYALPLTAEPIDEFPGLPLSDDEIRLIAWFMTDGGFSGYRLAISQSKDYHHEIRALLNRLGLDYTEQSIEPGEQGYANGKSYYRFTVPKGTAKSSLARNGWYPYREYLDKTVAPALHLMTRRQFEIFWEELLKGDGEQGEGKAGWLWCCEKAQVDAYTQMAIARGFSASYSERTTTNGKVVYRVSVREAQWITTDPNDDRASKVVLEKPELGEWVWCIRNQNSTIVTRRRGKIVILGNCNTVTHVLGIRAFGTQLLCEQVIGRALRRYSYQLNEKNRFDVEYADVFGIPFDFTAKPVVAPPKPPKRTVNVKAVRPERDDLTIYYPNVQGYRVELPDTFLTAKFTPDSRLEMTPTLVGAAQVQVSGIIGKMAEMNVKHLETVRESTVLYELTKHLIYNKYRDPGEEPKIHLFGQLKRIARQWMKECLNCTGGTYPAQLMYRELADMASDRIKAAITEATVGEQPIKAILDAYNPTGSSAAVNFNTSKETLWQPDPRLSPINWVVCDSDWEAEFCRVVESNPRVKAYVKNQGLGFEVPYLVGSTPRKYIPDFIVRVDDGHGPHDLLNLVVEIKGYRGEDAKDKANTMRNYWVPGVNNLGRFGRWQFAELTSVFEMDAEFHSLIDSFLAQRAA